VRRQLVALLALLSVPIAAGQQITPPAAPPTANAQTGSQTVYYAGPDVTAPKPPTLTLTDAATGRCKKLDGTVVLTAIVDEEGMARDVLLLHPIGNDLDKLAVRLVIGERFMPGIRNGLPVAVAVSIEVSLHTCIEDMNEAGQQGRFLKSRSLPVQKTDLQKPPNKDATLSLPGNEPPLPENATPATYHVGGDITAPILLHFVEVEFSEKAHEEKISGTCLISLIVDEYGLPQNVQVAKSLEPSLDQKALYAVGQYRFKPAMRNGTPVPVMITLEVDFRSF
jgi:TonB family protein